MRHGDDTVHGRLAVQATDEVGEIVEDSQIVLDGDDVVAGSKKTADDLGSDETLPNIEVGGRLVEHIHVGPLDAGHGDSETLQLSTRELDDLTSKDLVQLKDIAQFLLVVELELGVKHCADGHGALDGSGDVVDILGLNEGLEVVFKDLGEVVLELRSTEVFEDFLPVWWVLK